MREKKKRISSGEAHKSNTSRRKWALLPPWGAVRLSRGALRGKGTARGPRSGTFRTRCSPIYDWSDKTLGKWHHFFKLTHRIKNLLTVKQLLNSLSYFIVIVFPSGSCKPLFWRMFL
jgi:hypothetical protein